MVVGLVLNEAQDVPDEGNGRFDESRFLWIEPRSPYPWQDEGERNGCRYNRHCVVQPWNAFAIGVQEGQDPTPRAVHMRRHYIGALSSSRRAGKTSFCDQYWIM